MVVSFLVLDQTWSSPNGPVSFTPSFLLRPPSSLTISFDTRSRTGKIQGVGDLPKPEIQDLYLMSSSKKIWTNGCNVSVSHKTKNNTAQQWYVEDVMRYKEQAREVFVISLSTIGTWYFRSPSCIPGTLAYASKAKKQLTHCNLQCKDHPTHPTQLFNAPKH